MIRTRRKLSPSLAKLVIGVLVMSLFTTVAMAQDEPESTTTTERTLSVIGIGTASGSPDLAIVELGVEIRNQDIGEAVDQVNQIAEAITNALIEAGVAEEDIRTMSFNVRQDVVAPPPDASNQNQQPSDYVVSNIVQIRVQDANQLSSVIEAGLNAGANRVFGLRFALENQTDLENQALENAVADARTRGETMANALGVSLGDPIEVEEGGSVNRPLPTNVGLDIGGGGGGPVINEGQLTVTAHVTITYAINP